MLKNYYVILGIPTDSSLNDIKNAYRRLAKEYHPDHYARGRAPFLAIQEAYSVLSDPSRRREYDRSLDNVRIHVRPAEKERSWKFREEEAEPLLPHGRRGEPLKNKPDWGLGPQASNFFSFLDQFFDIISENRNYSGKIRPGLDMVVNLSREQATKGGHIRLKIPAQCPCPDCRGRGIGRFHKCRCCFGTGYLQGEIPLMLNYPSGVRHNLCIMFPLDRYGFAGKYLKVRFNIGTQR